MAELLEANKIFYTPYEPKLKNRFIMEISGIPAFTIKTMQRPQITFDEVVLEHMNITKYVKGKGRWQTLQITLYDPIVPSAASAVIEWIRLHHESATGRDGYQDFYKKNINFKVYIVIFFYTANIYIKLFCYLGHPRPIIPFN